MLIPGFNDSAAEVRDLTRFIAAVSPEIPWHVTAFHRAYKMTGTAETTPDMLRRAAEIGRQAGLQFVYAGNRPGQVGDPRTHRMPALRHPANRAGGVSRDPICPDRQGPMHRLRCADPGTLGHVGRPTDRRSFTSASQPSAARNPVVFEGPQAAQ